MDTPFEPAPEAESHPPLTIEWVHPSRRLDEALLERLVRHVVAEEKGQLRDLILVLADHETVLRLNRTYLGHDYLTDVLSFPLGDESSDVVEGEVYVDLDTAAERHAEFDASFEEETCRYVVHGVLHLLGYDDTTADGQAVMRTLEDRYLQAVADDLP